jgi:hypothetical protein
MMRGYRETAFYSRRRGLLCEKIVSKVSRNTLSEDPRIEEGSVGIKGRKYVGTGGSDVSPSFESLIPREGS